MKINVLEVFNSISGEASPYHQGCLTTFVRLAGCNLHCSYCDTPTAHDKGVEYIPSVLIGKLLQYYKKTGRLCVTGGEPLLQMGSVKYLLNYFQNSWVETNGTIDFAKIVDISKIVADFKLDTMKGEVPYYFYKLRNKDIVKFVIGDRSDFMKAVEIQRLLQLGGCQALFAFSPIHGAVSAKLILNLLLEYTLPNTIINTQMHKYLGLN